MGVAVFLSYVDRGNLSIAAPLLKDELHLSATQLGILLSAFFWSYTLCQVPAGWLTDRFDVTWILALGFLLWSVATTVTGFLHGFAALLVIRLVLGVGEAVAYPSYSNILARHFPEQHRGISNAILVSGQAAGPAFATFAGGMLIGKFGWRPFFIVLGLASLLWLLPWFRWRPRAQSTRARPIEPPFAAILQVAKQRSAWGTCIGLFSYDYYVYLILTWLPFYLVHERQFSLSATAKIGGSAFLLMGACAIVSGKLSDAWVSSGATPTLVRKTFLCAGLTSAGILLVLATLTPGKLSVELLLAAITSLGMSSPHHFAVSQTMAGPQMAGTWTGLQNFVGNFAGIVAPPITGYVIDRTGHFLWACVITAAVGLLGTLSWLLIVGQVRPVVWAQSQLPLTQLESSDSATS
ncbi:MAG: MFS transporter [Candidatus Acidiferrales bacterium]